MPPNRKKKRRQQQRNDDLRTRIQWLQNDWDRQQELLRQRAAVTGGPNPQPPAPIPDSSQDARDRMAAFFRSIGMAVDSELTNLIVTWIQNGYDERDIDVLMPDLTNTTAFKTRFPGYHQRISNGYNAINIGEYLRLEDYYRHVLSNSGLPAGFYDDVSDFGNFIANDVAPEEMEARITMAVDAAKRVDPTFREVMGRFYGVGTGDIAAYFLDPTRAQRIIEHQYQSAGVASYAAKHGLDISSITRYEELVREGITMDQAAQGYGTVAALTDTVGKLGSIYGETYDQTDAERDVFFQETDKRRRIVNTERSTWSGSSAGNTGSVNRGNY